MTEKRLPEIRIGFAYGASVNFPAGFLQPGESCRAKLRRYGGQELPDAVFTTARVGDQITMDLTEAQTASLAPGTYLTEMVIYQPLNPAADEIVITDNTFRIEAAQSPSA